MVTAIMTKANGNNGSRNIFRKMVQTISAVVLIGPAYSFAADWAITPTLNLLETYTDNVALAARGNEESDFITQINPGVALIGNGARLKVNVNYTMQNIFYASKSNRNRISHQLNSSANAELIQNFFFLDSTARISQQNISLLGPLTTNNENITNNRTTVKTYSISPYLRHNFSNFASTQARYTHNGVFTGVAGQAGSQAHSILLSLTSGSAFRRLSWGLNYGRQKTGGLGTTGINEKYMGNLRYPVSSKLSLTGTGGYQKFGFASTVGKSSGSFWTAGFVWTPARRTNITANGGDSFFGTTYTLDASHRTRRSVWSLNYNQSISTTRDQFLLPATIDTSSFLNQLWASSIPDPVIRQQTVDAFIQNNGLSASIFDSVNFFTNRYFLQKSWRGTVALSGARNTLVFSMFRTLREAQSSSTSDSILFGMSNAALNNDTKQIGGSALWSCQIGPRTSANISAVVTKSKTLDTDIDNDTKTFNAGLTRRIKSRLNGALNFRHVARSSNRNSGDSRENAVIASLTMSF